MIRIFLLNIILFFLPAIVYLLGVAILRRPQSVNNIRQLLERSPLVWLFMIGFFSVFGSLIYFSTFTGGKPGEVYRPPIFRDGKVIPGHRE
ncbi:MAG: hypothetical protein TECD_00973 [Hyphomicrobiaceae bacterium hypho_1]